MKMFLVKSSIKIAYYMSDHDAFVDDIRIVMAENLDEAGEKYEKYWEDKSEDYGTSFSVYSMKITETIM